MELVEREKFLALLRVQLKNIEDSEGHCVFISGEAGIGKTSLVKTFCREQKNNCNIYHGACDALFTPRPLAPIYDIMWQVNSDLPPDSYKIEERSELFTGVFRELSNQQGKTIIVFEDIHWADEATLDFIKFFARRISQVQCLFILTYRDDEIHSRHPLKNVLGQLPQDSFTRLKLTPLSRLAVEKMAAEKGYNGEDVYSISGGNPFYVNEILASYSTGVPDNIKDSILSIYNRQDEKTKYVWEILSILPTGFDIKYFEKAEPVYAESVHKSLDTTILVLRGEMLFFKHELYRRTIEASLSPLTTIRYNKKVLDVFMETYEKNQQIERLVHHAKNANEYGMVVQYAPLAAKQAASVGAHIEAARLYLTAIEYYQGNDKDVLIEFYEGYAYECYLTSNTKEAIVYAQKSLDIWKEKNNVEKIANCLRLLSRLWWFSGHRKDAEDFAEQAIEVLKDFPPCSSKAMAFSNMSQLKMLADQSAECILWGEKAIALARELGDEEILCHALNNVGSMQMKIPVSTQQGLALLQQSLAIALKNSYHDHVARAYCNIAGTSCTMKEYLFSRKILEEGIAYCEERDLDTYTLYMLSWKARLNFETGCWKEACHIAENLLKNDGHACAVRIAALAVVAKIKIRRGDPDALPLLLEAKKMAFETMELQRIIPVLIGLLEYEWITGKCFIETEAIDRTINMIKGLDFILYNNEFAFWLLKARNQHLPLGGMYEGFDLSSATKKMKAAALWRKAGSPYMEALALFEGNDNDKRKAITIVHKLGANAVYEKMRREMRTSGIKNIPRGIRKTTQANPALLTTRELDVLALLKEDLQNKEIAARLFISGRTVDHHISSIFFKLGVNSRNKAVTAAARQEIIK
jgi:DNA-binding CsgD family transcriptional regulator/tetratricopeptide (TPR) repeat protein